MENGKRTQSYGFFAVGDSINRVASREKQFREASVDPCGETSTNTSPSEERIQNMRGFICSTNGHEAIKPRMARHLISPTRIGAEIGQELTTACLSI